MNYSALDKLINTDTINSKIFLFYGEEKYIRQQYVNKIKKCFDSLIKGINYIVLEDSSIDNLISEINSPAFGFEYKLIICNNSKIFKQKRAKNSEQNDTDSEDVINNSAEADIINYFEKNEIKNVTIVFSEDEITKTKKIFKIIEKLGIVTEFKKQTPNDLVTYVLDLCPKYKVNISRNVATYFIDICNNSMDDINNELSKLVYFVGQNGTIEKEHIDLVTTKAIDSIVFDLTDKLGAKDSKSALIILDELLSQKEPLQKLYIMLYRHYKNLYFIKYILDNKLGSPENLLELNPYVAKKATEQAKNYSLADIQYLYKSFMMIDINNKQGTVDLYTNIVKTICSI